MERCSTSSYLLAFICISVCLFDTIEAKKANSTEGKHWGLLIAGSNTWGNYRHQADICHAYHILHNHGIPDENIVVMMYDDIAHNEENPTPGVIINKIGGPNVYKGVVKDYTKEAVTPEVFLDVLQGIVPKQRGRKVGSGKVIDSGPNDKVFVNFADHGAPGLIAFPEGELYADDLNRAIKNMHENKRYKEMVFYIEACESGSMFHRLLPNNIKVYATTAANPDESSYACYFDKKLETYLGDVYSVKWMENSDSADLETETLLRQYKIVKRETNTSHVMQYGDMGFENEAVDNFQGDPEAVTRPMISINPAKTHVQEPEFDAVPAPDVPIAILEYRLKATKDPVTKKLIKLKLDNELKTRLKIEETVKKIATLATNSDALLYTVLHKPAAPRNFDCYKKAIKTFKTSCFNFVEYEYALRHVYVLSNLCENNIPVQRIQMAISGTCRGQKP